MKAPQYNNYISGIKAMKTKKSVVKIVLTNIG